MIVIAGAALCLFGCSAPAPDSAPQSEPEAAAVSQPATAATKTAPQEAAEATPAPEADDSKYKLSLPEVVARVADEEVKGKDFGRHVAYNLKMMEARGMPVNLTDAQIRELLDDFVNDKVLEILAKQDGLTASDEDVRKEFERGKRSMLSDAIYRNYLQDLEMTEPELFELLRGRILKDRYLDVLLRDTTVSDEDIAAEYAQMAQNGRTVRREPTVDFSQILVRVQPGAEEATWVDARTRAEALYARLVSGEAFDAVAREVSEDGVSALRGGHYFEMPPARMQKTVHEHLAALAPGAYSAPFQTQAGWHIVQLQALHEPGAITLDDAREAIRLELLRRKRQQVMRERVAEARKTIPVEILLPESSTPDKPLPEAESGGPTAPAPQPEHPAAQPELTPGT